jgi:hypothetical protein
VFVHGFASVSGVLRPTLAHLSRNSSTGLIESDTTVIVQDFDPLPGLQDTASFAVVEDGTPGYGPHLYVADYTREDDELYVYRTGFDGSSFDPTFTQVYYDNTKGAARITALGRGPTGKQDYSNEDLADRYVSMCLSNTADGATDGEILVAKFIGNYTGTPTGLLNAPVPVGTHNGECTSIDATKQGSLVVGGRLIAMPINQPDLASILLGDADPVELETDHRTTNSAVPNTLFYASNFVIAASAFENGAPPIAGRSIERARGFSMLPAAGTLRVAFSNDQTAGAANAFAAKVELGGATQKVVAQVKATQGNLNSSAVFTGFHPGTNDDLPGWLPKGQMKANDMRITPTPTCRTRGATVALAYRCIAEKMGIDIDEVEVLPTPTPTPTPEPTATPTPTPPDTGGPSGGGDVDGAVDIGGGGSSGGGRDPSCPAGQDPEDC